MLVPVPLESSIPRQRGTRQRNLALDRDHYLEGQATSRQRVGALGLDPQKTILGNF